MRASLTWLLEHAWLVFAVWGMVSVGQLLARALHRWRHK